MQLGRAARTGSKHGYAQAGAWKEPRERSNEGKEAPPSAVGVLLASEVSEPGSSDPSSAGVCRGDSGTYTVSPSAWLPLPALPCDFGKNSGVESFGAKNHSAWNPDGWDVAV